MSNNEAQRALKTLKLKVNLIKTLLIKSRNRSMALPQLQVMIFLNQCWINHIIKKKLIKELLSTRLGNNEASQIAKKLANGHLSQSQIVDQLKRYFDKNGHATADDILNGVLNNAKNKKKQSKRY